MSVWVTRSEPRASRLVDALQQAQLSVIRCPAVEIVDKPGELIALEEGAALQTPTHCIVVSQHAASRYRDSRWFQAQARHIAVGRATQEALRHEAQVPEHPTTEGIMSLSVLQASALKERACCIWIVSGVGGREDLAMELLARGVDVFKLELYERRRALMTEFLPMPGDVVEVSSQTALEAIFEKIPSATERQGVTLLLPSERIDRLARERKFYNTRIARSAEIADVVATACETQSG